MGQLGGRLRVPVLLHRGSSLGLTRHRGGGLRGGPQLRFGGDQHPGRLRLRAWPSERRGAHLTDALASGAAVAGWGNAFAVPGVVRTVVGLPPLAKPELDLSSPPPTVVFDLLHQCYREHRYGAGFVRFFVFCPLAHMRSGISDLPDVAMEPHRHLFKSGGCKTQGQG